MKKTILSLSFILIGTFVFAKTNVNEVSIELVVNELQITQRSSLNFDKLTESNDVSLSYGAYYGESNFSVSELEKKAQVFKKDNEIQVEVAGPDCVAFRFQSYVEARRLGLNERDASAASYNAYFYCMAIM